MRELMQQLEADETPAPAPIEQRWSASSSAPMSPVASRGTPDTLHSWVGIIMYLPTEDKHSRKAITDRCGFPHCLVNFVTEVMQDSRSQFRTPAHGILLGLVERSISNASESPCIMRTC